MPTSVSKIVRACWLAIVVAAGFQPAAAPAATSWDLVNQAQAVFQDVENGAPLTLQSNVTTATVPMKPPDVEWTGSTTPGDTIDVADTDTTVHVQVDSHGCNIDPNRPDAVLTVVRALKSGDEEIFDAWEESSHSGHYRVAQKIEVERVVGRNVHPHNGIVEANEDDVLSAWVEGCGTGVDEDFLLIDPRGVVFDSQTFEPVAGATVRLVDVTGAGNGGNPGGDAVVFEMDAVTRAPSVVTTTADGYYQFPLVPPSVYVLQVQPPGDYVFPSTAAPEVLAQHRIVHAPGSFGGNFAVNVQTGAVELDLPLDTSPAGLILEKRAARTTVEIAETLQYSIAMRNISGLALTQLTLRDWLPPGFEYVPGSAKLDDAPIADPLGGKGPQLEFAIDALAAEERTLTYRVAIGPGALEGDGTNRAQLTSNSPARKTSNMASVKVTVNGGVFDDRAYVLGKIFADCNSNGVQDAGEAGVPRVRLYMEDGSYVISDGGGKYSFYGVTPRTHVLKVDATTLPPGATLAPISQRHGRDGNSRFIDVKKSEMHRADFATSGCSPALAAEIVLRKDASDNDREIDLGLKAELKTTDAYASLGDVRALPASGIVGENLSRENAARSMVPPQSGPAPTVDLNTLLGKLDPKLGFIGLSDGDAVGSTQVAVRAKGLAHSDIRLRVNDVEVGADRVGLRVVDEQRRVQALEFVGVSLQPGDNELQLTQRDSFGNLREISTIHLVAAGDLAKIVVTTSAEGVPADGEQHAIVDVELQDMNGVPVAARTPVTLETTLGEWLVQDLDPAEPGTQVFVEGGQAKFALRSMQTGGSRVRVTAMGSSSEANVSFVAALRPLIAVGVIEGTLSMKKLDPKSIVATRSEDGFERELRQWSAAGKEGSGAARAALFLKGRIRGDYLLTMGFDSDKEPNERLFRDIQPDQFYPVYGDSSVKGYDAQSTGKLYVRVDRNKSYLLGGDITTQSLSQARILGAYSRSLTGVKEHFETDRVAIDVFGSYDSATQTIEEIPANGTSGPFFLGQANALENSEQIEIVTRDRDQPAVIINAVAQQRFVDYEIEPLTGRVLFRASIPSVDEDLNPVSIRITYEVDQGGEDFWTAGAETQVKVTDSLEIGGAYVHDDNPLDERRLASASSTLKLGKATTLIGEVARTDQPLEDSGLGSRMELRHEGAKLQARAFGVRTDGNFDNPSAGIAANRSEAGAKAGYSLTERTRVVGEMLHSVDIATDATRDGALLGVERSLGNNIKAELGARHVIDDPATSDETQTTSLRTKVTAPIPGAPRASIFGEYEQDVADSDGKVIAAGGAYQLANRSKLYARHEFISSLTGPYALDPTQKHNTTVFGVDTSYWKDDRLFSEYRIADALSGRAAQAAIGLRNGWQVARGVRLHTTFERVDALRGASEGETSAVTGAIEYTRNPLWKGTARLELSDTSSSSGLLSTLGVAYKLSEDWTLLGKNVLALTDNDGATPDRTQDRFQLGMAYRASATNRINGLGRYELKHEENVEAGLTREVHIVSLHADLQATQRLLWRGQYAAKFVQERIEGMSMNNAAHLIGGRVTYDLAQRWDVGLNTRALFDRKFDGFQGGVGAEVGFLVHDNLWLSVGYNVVGFRDDDLAADEYTSRGAYLRLRFKFDEELLQ